MKRIICLMLVLFCIASIMFTGCGQKKETGIKNGTVEDPIMIKIAHDNSVQTPGHKAIEGFKKEVEAQSGGRIKVEIYPGGQMGSIQDTMEQTRRGDIQMSFAATSLLIQNMPELAVWEVFGLFDDKAHAHRVLDGKAGQKMMEYLEAENLEGIGYMEIGFRNFSNSKRPINTKEDVKGLKMRGYNSVQIKAWEALGANLSSLSWNEVFTSLQQGLIDGQECTTESFYSAKFNETQNYWSLTQHIYTNWLWYANQDFMDSLSEEDRGIVMDASKKAIHDQREEADRAEKKNLELIKASRTIVNEVPLEARAEMTQTMNEAVSRQIIDKCGQDVYDMVMEEVEKERHTAE